MLARPMNRGAIEVGRRGSTMERGAAGLATKHGRFAGRQFFRLALPFAFNTHLMSVLTLDEGNPVHRQIVNIRPRIDGQERNLGMERNSVRMRNLDILVATAQCERQEWVMAEKRLNLRENSL
jgi:hypothetical protein